MATMYRRSDVMTGMYPYECEGCAARVKSSNPADECRKCGKRLCPQCDTGHRLGKRGCEYLPPSMGLAAVVDALDDVLTSSAAGSRGCPTCGAQPVNAMLSEPSEHVLPCTFVRARELVKRIRRVHRWER